MQMYFCFEDIERVFAVDCHFPKEKLSINQTLLSQGVDKLNFERISYKDSMNRVRDAYQEA